MINFIFYINFLFLPLCHGQNTIVELGAWVSPSEKPILHNDQFLMIDFWATWCGPCIKAMDHMAELQKVTEDKVAYISVTKEHKEIVENFFSSRTPKTLIAIDYEGRTFDKFNVQSLPYSVLIAPNGEVVWQGMPNEMNFEKIKRLTSYGYGKAKPVSQKLITYKNEVKKVKKENSIKLDGINAHYTIAETSLTFNRTDENCDKVDFSGHIVDMVSSLMNIPKQNVTYNSPSPSFGYFSVDTCTTLDNQHKILNLMMKSFKMKYDIKEEKTEAYFIKIKDPTLLWSKDVYEWDENGKSNFLHSDFDLQADNYSVAELAALLSRLMNVDIRYDGKNNEIYDWSMMMGDFDFMLKNLQQEHGLQLVKKNIMSSKIIITQ